MGFVNYTLDGQTIKNPSKFKIDRFKITQSSRVASGDMMMELVAKKRKFQFTYEAITSSDLNKILDIIWESNDVFFQLSYIENNQQKTAKVYVGNIPSDLYRADEGEWVWTNVSFSLIEQ